MNQVANPDPRAAQPRNGFGITALVLALIGLVFSLIPLTGFLALILGVLAVLFGLLGVARTRKGVATNKIMSWIGTGLGGLSLAVGMWGMVILFQATDQFVRDMDKIATDMQAPPAPGTTSTPEGIIPAAPVTEAEPGPGVVRYEVDGTGTAMSVDYSTGNSGGFSSKSVSDVHLPWSVEVPVNSAGFAAFSLMASNDADGGTITCRILVDGQVVQEATSEGPYQAAVCMK